MVWENRLFKRDYAVHFLTYISILYNLENNTGSLHIIKITRIMVILAIEQRTSNLCFYYQEQACSK